MKEERPKIVLSTLKSGHKRRYYSNIVVGGRFKNAQIGDEAKHQKISLYRHKVTDLIIEQYIEVNII